MNNLKICAGIMLLLSSLISVGLATFKTNTDSTEPFTLDVIDLRGSNETTRLLALSLQGIVNKNGPRIYVLWESKDEFGNPSEEWAKYYKSKG